MTEKQNKKIPSNTVYDYPDVSSGNSETMEISSQSDKKSDKLCLLKFYNWDNKEKIDFNDNFTDALLEYGYQSINNLIENLNSTRPTYRRLIYSHRHMGTTCLLKAIEKVWTGNYKGKREYYENGDVVVRACKYVSLKGESEKTELGKNLPEELLAEKLKNLIEEDLNGLDNLTCNNPCAAIDNHYIDNIKRKLLECLEDISKSQPDSQYKKLLLLDDLDVFLCDKSKKLTKKWLIWSYRKYCIKAILEINKEESDKAIIASIHTRLFEYRDDDEREGKTCRALGLEGDELWNLYNEYGTIIQNLGDACFFQCPTSGSKEDYKCELVETCTFQLDDTYFHTDVSFPEISDEKKRHIRDYVLKERYKECNHNPWWLIVPMTHIFPLGDSDSCTYNIDEKLKDYYKDKGEARPTGNIIDEFFSLLQLYVRVDVNNKCDIVQKKYEEAAKAYKRIIRVALDKEKEEVILKRKKKRKKKRKPPVNSSIKMMLEDSGLIFRGEKYEPTLDNFEINGFVRYIYSDKKFFNKS